MNTPAEELLQWYDHIRRDLPWRRTADPYRIWLSEIMLQQTRVESVKGYYARFLEACPTVEALAAAPIEQVLKWWEGLGYYSRARNLHRAAQLIVEAYGGAFPSTYEEILKLPGVGPYTAGAIASIAFHQPVPAVDGNVYRVISRFLGIREDVGAPAVQKRFRQEVLTLMPPERPGDFNQALMELGATLCSPTSPRCEECPWQESCDAFDEGDMESLPIHEKKKPQKVLPMAVCLMTFGNRVFVMKRTERLLNGLFVFALLEGETVPERCAERLSEVGFSCAFRQKLGEARHVFTHRIWEMEILHFELTEEPSPALLEQWEGRMVSLPELEALAMPTAIRAARIQAQEILNKEPAER